MMNLSLINPANIDTILSALQLVAVIFGIGAILLVLMFKANLKALWQSNVGQRYVGWLIVIGLFGLAVFGGGHVAQLVLHIVLFLAIWEIDRVAGIPKIYIGGLYLSSIVSVLTIWYAPSIFYGLPIFYFLLFSTLGVLENKSNKSLINTALSVYFSLWLIFSLCHFVLLDGLNYQLDQTRGLIIMVAFAVVGSDIGAYLVGKTVSRIRQLPQTKIASNLSPKKTIIGATGNILGAGVGISLSLLVIVNYLPWYEWLILAVLIGAFGVIGDITASMYKRYFGIKDSSQLIPGHGGVLDRIDSSLRVILVVYYYFLLFH